MKAPTQDQENSIPSPRMSSQVENLRPREGQVLYQATQQMMVMMLGLRADSVPGMAPSAVCGFSHSVLTR